MVSAPDAFLSQPVIVTMPFLISYFKLGLTGTSSVGLVSARSSSGLISATDSSSPHPPRSRGSVKRTADRSKFFMV